MSLRLRAAILLAACAPLDIEAQEGGAPRPGESSHASAGEGGRVTYDAGFYEQFQPQTALDMLSRTPGFVVVAPSPDELLRGFAANAGNVLVDGQRPTVKSGGLEAYLSRIPANRVARIEILRSAQTGEAQGQSLVADLVLRTDARASGAGSFELRRAPGDTMTPKLETTYAFPAGSWRLSAGLVALYETNPIGGRYERFDALGRLVGSLDEAFDQREREAILTGSAERAVAGGRLTLNARLLASHERYAQVLIARRGAADSRLDGEDVDYDVELGADWLRPIGGGWATKLVGLARTETSDTKEAFESGDDARSSFVLRGRNAELVARAAAYRDSASRFRPEVTAEIAWNRLGADLALVENGGPVDLPGADVAVTELRGEVGASLTARLVSGVRGEAGLSHERSRIAVAGAAGGRRSLAFWKPAAAIVWDADTATQLRFGWRRTVEQLDMAAFVASANLADGRPIAGAAELRPATTDAWSLKVDRRFGSAGGAVSLTIAKEKIRDALTYIPIASGGEALLNFGDVDLWRLSGEATLPLDRWVSGARLTASARAAWARRPDPVVGTRRKDWRDFREGSIAFRHDLTRLRAAYGVRVEAWSMERAWYVAEYEEEQNRPYVTAYVETTALAPGMKTTLTAHGLAGERERRERYFFAPDRGGDPAGLERRRRHRGAYVNLLFERQF